MNLLLLKLNKKFYYKKRRILIMAKWVCSVCGYVHEGDTAPEVCPICKAPAEKFTKQDDEMAMGS